MNRRELLAGLGAVVAFPTAGVGVGVDVTWTAWNGYGDGSEQFSTICVGEVDDFRTLYVAEPCEQVIINGKPAKPLWRGDRYSAWVENVDADRV